MGKSKKQKRQTQLKRREMIQDVFKKGKKQREIAKKFDEKISQRQGTSIRREKIRQMKSKKRENTVNRDQIAELDKKFESIRANKKL